MRIGYRVATQDKNHDVESKTKYILIKYIGRNSETRCFFVKAQLSVQNLQELASCTLQCVLFSTFSIIQKFQKRVIGHIVVFFRLLNHTARKYLQLEPAPILMTYLMRATFGVYRFWLQCKHMQIHFLLERIIFLSIAVFISQLNACGPYRLGATCLVIGIRVDEKQENKPNMCTI